MMDLHSIRFSSAFMLMKIYRNVQKRIEAPGVLINSGPGDKSIQILNE